MTTATTSTGFWQGGILLAALAAWTPTDAAAQLACGDTVPEGAKVTLTQDIGPCDGMNTAIILESATLDLGGHTLTCAEMNDDGDVPWGVVLSGKKAQVRNGTIVGCYAGVYVDDTGKHRVEGLTVTRSWRDGIYVASDSSKNRIAGNILVANGDDGMEVRGDKNKITGNMAQDNGEDGIDITSADKNSITRNTATGNADDGIEASGTANKVSGNTSNGNGGWGIAIIGSKNKVVGNAASGNSGDIGGSSCSANRFKRNTVGRASACVN